MARIAISAAFLLHVFSSGTAFADEITIPDEIQKAADTAGVDPVDLLGAVSTTHLDAATYLCQVGEGDCPKPACGWPICGALGQRIYCVEQIESNHGLYMYNPTPWPPGTTSHAQGWLGFLPSTARTWGAVIGNRVSEWSAAAKMIAAGAGGQFFGISARIC